ncbi:polyprenyl synthetase family protein [Brachyspira pilosicoli]|uniref:polyprenyl synthetase family protein n=1 Tax=Brachyspira pilosicoli TaxID=52584 RepID=UPI000E159F2D|nr:farnesyl diphosphate synthase [Brachyspira pilosicoli]MBW5377643.1 polyprenyl synthetase family protein [Brachyspira pilosicoli]SUW07415.1 geranylgeranyl pyrophosphate synthase [Brachyspira pilosicoli]
MNLKEYMNIRLKDIDSEINNIFKSSSISLENNFLDMLKYPLDAGGKRLRPILTCLACELFNGDYKKAIIPAVSLELIHTYSLVHDDLPAMDNDDLRRGKPTTHVKYGEANAILVGDGLLTHSFEILSNANVNDKTLRKLLYEISYAAGVSGMVMGQFIDLYYEERDIDFEMLKILHSKKTGAMIRGAVRVGAIASEKENINLENITKYGEAIGLAFQIQDDILDVISDNETLGKTVGKDEKEGKLTYVKQFGLDGAKEKAIETSKEAIDYLNVYDDNEAKNILIELANYIVERKS